MVCPQRSLDDTRGYSRHTDPVEFIEVGHRAHETADRVLGGRIDRSREGRILPSNTGNMEDVFGLFVVTEAEEVRDGELGCADWMGDVDVDQAVTPSSKIVFAGRRAGGAPEVAPMLLLSAVNLLVVEPFMKYIPVRRHQPQDRRDQFLQTPSLRLRTFGPAVANRSRLLAERLP